MPGDISIESLAESFGRLASRSAILRDEVGPALNSQPELVRLLKENPVAAWAGGRGTGGQAFFAYQDGKFSSRIPIAPDLRVAFQELVRELADWRLAEYLSRSERNATAPGEFSCKVSHSGDRPILFLPDRATHPEIPSGWVVVEADEQRYEANFVKVAVNVMREPGSEKNSLPDILTQWFGQDAGRPGTNNHVVFEPTGEGFRMRPAGERSEKAE